MSNPASFWEIGEIDFRRIFHRPCFFRIRPARGAGIRRAGEVFRGLGYFFELSETPGRAAIHGFASRIVGNPPAASRPIGLSVIFIEIP